MKIQGSIALVTGANGGIGQAFVAELIRRGASKIYVAGRSKKALEVVMKSQDQRLVPIILDVTNELDIDRAVQMASDVSLLINNAGYSAMTGALSADALVEGRREMEVNYFGPLRMTRAFAPVLAKVGGGAIVNVLSFLSVVTMPLHGTYSASKAAALALSRSSRAELAGQGTLVVAAMPVAVDTPMGAWSNDPRVTPHDAASDTLDAVEAGETEVYPGEISRGVAAAFAADPKAVHARVLSRLPTK